jgi:hypothetical protein
MRMDTKKQQLILYATGASSIRKVEKIQQLWSGYGSIVRCHLDGSDRRSVVVKQVLLAGESNHPRGWDTALSHQRKLQSYIVESAWYRNWSKRCTPACRVPQCLALDESGDETLMVFEDLDEAGFPARNQELTPDELAACLGWLANFHAIFMGEMPTGLWPQGTYWHLATRPDELEALDDLSLKDAAASIDARLNESSFQTIVHGDAKLANFCFSNDGRQVAAVDFQYVGGGCGMKDVAYFIGSCLDEQACEAQEKLLLDTYFAELGKALNIHHPEIDGEAVENDWRPLYPVAWCDFHRFLKGWSPGHWKIHGYSERLAREVIASMS